MSRSQNDLVLQYLRRVGHLTTLLAFRRWNCLRLSARIWDLRRNGHKIIAERQQRGLRHWARYRLAK